MGKRKKRGAPERACVKCGKGYHPRRKECPHCGAKSPAAKRSAKKSVAKRASAKQPARAAAPADTLDVAIRFVESAGGFKRGVFFGLVLIRSSNHAVYQNGSDQQETDDDRTQFVHPPVSADELPRFVNQY